jgi:hypothetical protein
MAAVQAQPHENGSTQGDSNSNAAVPDSVGVPGRDDLDRLETFGYLTRHASLDRALESPHITGRSSSEMYSRDLTLFSRNRNIGNHRDGPFYQNGGGD